MSIRSMQYAFRNAQHSHGCSLHHPKYVHAHSTTNSIKVVTEQDSSYTNIYNQCPCCSRNGNLEWSMIFIQQSGISTRNTQSITLYSLLLIYTYSIMVVCVITKYLIRECTPAVLRAPGIGAKQRLSRWKECTDHSFHLTWMSLCRKKDGVEVVM